LVGLDLVKWKAPQTAQTEKVIFKSLCCVVARKTNFLLPLEKDRLTGYM
jgi:hypothetical protein